jgi:hypothetical protein
MFCKQIRAILNKYKFRVVLNSAEENVFFEVIIKKKWLNLCNVLVRARPLVVEEVLVEEVGLDDSRVDLKKDGFWPRLNSNIKKMTKNWSPASCIAIR